MGITGLIPFLDKASKTINISEFNGCTVAIDSYCWLHKGAFACADKLVRGEDTDVYIKYCLKYVNMLLANNIKPILVFDGRHLPAKATTEAKRRELRDVSRKRAAELLSLGKTDEARSCMRRCVDITHEMALKLIKECRSRRVDCIVGPYEADAQLAYLNINNIAQVVITEDSDLILFGCNKVLFKMDLDGTGVLVETCKLPLIMKCPIEHYRFEKFLRMCILSGCDYLPSLPGIGLVKARQFVNATQDTNFANALRKLPNFFNKLNLTVTDEYRESFLKAEATFKHQYVYDPINRRMVRLTELDGSDIENLLCIDAGAQLDSRTAYQLALGNLDPFTLRRVDDWDPDKDILCRNDSKKGVSSYPSIWSKEFEIHLKETRPWRKKTSVPNAGAETVRRKKKVVNLLTKYVPETQDESLSIESLSKMYCIEPPDKRLKFDDDAETSRHDVALTDSEISDELTQTQKEQTSPILQSKMRSFRTLVTSGDENFLKRLSRFPRTVIDKDRVVESKFFNSDINSADSGISEKVYDNIEKLGTDSLESVSDATNVKSPDPHVNPFRIKLKPDINNTIVYDLSTDNDMDVSSHSSQKENSPVKRCVSPVLDCGRPVCASLNRQVLSQDSAIENSCFSEDLGTASVAKFAYGNSQSKLQSLTRLLNASRALNTNLSKKSSCRVSGLRKSASLPSNQPTLLAKFGFQKRPILKK